MTSIEVPNIQLSELDDYRLNFMDKGISIKNYINMRLKEVDKQNNIYTKNILLKSENEIFATINDILNNYIDHCKNEESNDINIRSQIYFTMRSGHNSNIIENYVCSKIKQELLKYGINVNNIFVEDVKCRQNYGNYDCEDCYTYVIVIKIF